MAQDINYSPKQYDSESSDYIIEHPWWCEKCLSMHYGSYSCPYNDIEYYPHCGKVIR